MDILDLPLPDWAQITELEYEPWNRERLVADTAGRRPEDSPAPLVEAVLAADRG
ncbi:hypothetical protein [Streptomyces shaanxiensis]